jgi:selenocysteine-specific elongation factor
MAKVVLMEERELMGGHCAYAQLRLSQPCVSRKGDRFVIRRLSSPPITIGGGEILDPSPLKHRRGKPEIIRQFQTKDSGSHLERVELAILERPGQYSSLEELIVRADLDRSQARSDARLLSSRGRLFMVARDIFIHLREKEALAEKLKKILSEYHKANPYSPGLPMEEARRRLFPKDTPKGMPDGFLTLLSESRLVNIEGEFLSLCGFSPLINSEENQYMSRLEDYYLGCAFQPLATSQVLPAQDSQSERLRKGALIALSRKEAIRQLDDLYYLHQSHYQRALAILREMLEEDKSPVTASRFRDRLGSSRKVAVAILESFDKAGLTMKEGEGRLLRSPVS